MAPCFAAAIGSIDRIRTERDVLWKAGLSPVDAMQMTRWQRLDLFLRHRKEAKDDGRKLRAATKKKKLGVLIGLLTKRLLRM